MTALIGIPVLLFVCDAYGVLSPRKWAIGMAAWFLAVLVWAIVAKRREIANQVDGCAKGELDEATREWILRDIRRWKVWIGVLIVCLPIGIANGAAHRAWVPTLIGVAVNLGLMLGARQLIRERRRRLSAIESVVRERV
jgi:hypothetical protein